MNSQSESLPSDYIQNRLNEQLELAFAESGLA